METVGPWTPTGTYENFSEKNENKISECQNLLRLHTVDDDGGCKTGVGRTRSRGGVDHEQARSRTGAGQE